MCTQTHTHINKINYILFQQQNCSTIVEQYSTLFNGPCSNESPKMTKIHFTYLTFPCYFFLREWLNAFLNQNNISQHFRKSMFFAYKTQPPFII